MAMNQPSLDHLLQKADSCYSLVVIAAKRAREITESLNNEDNGGDAISVKPVTYALQEISHNEVKYRRTKLGIK